jgi:hypothetical protein
MLRGGEPLDCLALRARVELTSVSVLVDERGMPRREILRELKDFRPEARELRPEDKDEDIVLDVMDFVQGWASRHVRL